MFEGNFGQFVPEEEDANKCEICSIRCQQHDQIRHTPFCPHLRSLLSRFFTSHWRRSTITHATRRMGVNSVMNEHVHFFGNLLSSHEKKNASKSTKAPKPMVASINIYSAKRRAKASGETVCRKLEVHFRSFPVNEKIAATFFLCHPTPSVHQSL